jgi:lipopolysaccharide export system protein LptA
MLRRARWLILLAIVVIAAFVASIYIAQKKALRRARPQISAPLPSNTSATAQLWEYEIKSGDRAKIRLRAKHFEQVKAPSTFLFEDLEMEIRDKTETKYDLVKSARASFDQESGLMYSEGDVEMTMNLPLDEQKAAGRILKIRSSGVTLEVKTSRASTDRKAYFEFDRGSGECVGTVYDPVAHELQMKSEVKLDWRGDDPSKPPMHVEAGFLNYKEQTGEIFLSPTAKLQRDTFTLESAESVVTLKDGLIDKVVALKAHGTDHMPNRQLDYQAEHLVMYFTPKAEISKIEASDAAKLVSTSVAGVTDVTADRLDLDFDTAGDASVLKRALATGKGRIEARSVQRPGQSPRGPRVLTSEVIEATMRKDGKEIERVVTHAPGQVDLLPGKKGEKNRRMNGERIYVDYGPDNAIEKLRAVDVTTRTESEGKGGAVVTSTTRSKDLQADFDPKTGDLTRMDQWNDFQYQEGARHATATRASLDETKNVITLTTKARMWDDTGSTSADQIVLDQKTDDMVATGNVSSTRLPDKKQANEGLFSAGEPIQARAEKMTTAEKNQKIRYEGRALMWQASSRIQAKTIFINRKDQLLEAAGDVITQLPDQRGDSPPAGSKKPSNAFTIVKAQSLVYSDKTGEAYYAGGVTLERPSIEMKSKELRAFFVKQPKPGGGEETELNHMVADGNVEVIERAADRSRTGTSEHAEYFPGEERFVLTGGNPMVVDNVRGTTRGSEITWLSRQDRLLVNNTGSGPSVSRIKQKPQKQ